MKNPENNTQFVNNTSEQSNEHHVRVEKVTALRAAGFEPWPGNKEVNATATEVIAEFDESKESRVYHVAGRLMNFREHGKTAFAHIQDRTGKLQVYMRQDEIGQAFDWFKHFVDVGDIVWFAGTSFKTKTGEITIKAKEVALLSKCLHPLPEKFHGLADVETAYRQRYLDLISNPESRERFKKRSAIVRTIRNFLDGHDFMEVETPMLQVIPGGAAARPFVTHHNTLDMELYLRIAPELYLKRLVVGGFDRVYEINRNFRNEGISTKHNPEFTMLEFYIAYKDYHFAMDLVETLLRTVATQVCGTLQVPFGEHTLDFHNPFARLSMRHAVKQYGKLSDADLTDQGIDAVIQKNRIHIANKEAAWGHKLYALFEHFVEPNLVQPTFITEFPIEVSPLAKRDERNPNIAARFELFIAGVELSNGFNELNDPFDQADRFKAQARDRSAGDIEAHHYDADYVQALEYALPPTAGVGIGIDRLTMFLTNTTSIKDVILFPTLKKRE
jgi:lysyl-tRNA synthetase class 2